MRLALCPKLVAVSFVAVLAACGGGGGSDTPTAAPAAATGVSSASSASSASSTAATPEMRASAAESTAQSGSNACNAIRPFYWEIGDSNAKAASGSVDSPTASVHFDGVTPLSIASASKWIYGAYVVEKRAGALTDVDRRFLTMQSGYMNLKNCDPSQTIDSCLAAQATTVYTAADEGKFYYDGGHMQKHASLSGLGGMTPAALTAEVQAQIGTDVPLVYTLAQPGGGLAMSADAYAQFLRKVLRGELGMRSALGASAVCTNPQRCGNAVYTPTPASESWHYSVGHWVEDDPTVGDGAFSSAGSFGFYPWIDAGKTSYGVIARVAQAGSGYDSALCGRLLRKAWATGVSQ